MNLYLYKYLLKVIFRLIIKVNIILKFSYNIYFAEKYESFKLKYN